MWSPVMGASTDVELLIISLLSPIKNTSATPDFMSSCWQPSIILRSFFIPRLLYITTKVPPIPHYAVSIFSSSNHGDYQEPHCHSILLTRSY
ncbi:hypothetical protein L873DRAFT_1822315 [Choiromyces venosus 120613-1]|uniref:Uncharacterized protein n=1 Tax=Choiromyces venosus 120613-1 TaxID=1336337 RepID=A0A3N4IZW0_9PEZI|nr:hypothetical protein L873DRAFT_1822315 [Choiromyces venosus 120613-1]